ncbi:T9SS type A sorting domain-containing protein [Candidatus Neomarinimicrobiota bacterium]
MLRPIFIFWLIYFPLGHIFAQTSNINVDGNSIVEIFEGSKVCVDEIIVQGGSSFSAYDYGQVNESDCETILTPTGTGTVTLPVELDGAESIPVEFSIKPAYPNPFNPSTTIHYSIPEESEVTIMIYDLMGRQVTTLFHNRQKAGWYEITWNGLIQNGSIAPAGMYIYQIIAGEEIKTSKISLIK